MPIQSDEQVIDAKCELCKRWARCSYDLCNGCGKTHLTCAACYRGAVEANLADGIRGHTFPTTLYGCPEGILTARTLMK